MCFSYSPSTTWRTHRHLADHGILTLSTSVTCAASNTVKKAAWTVTTIRHTFNVLRLDRRVTFAVNDSRRNAIEIATCRPLMASVTSRRFRVTSARVSSHAIIIFSLIWSWCTKVNAYEMKRMSLCPTSTYIAIWSLMASVTSRRFNVSFARASSNAICIFSDMRSKCTNFNRAKLNVLCAVLPVCVSSQPMFLNVVHVTVLCTAVGVLGTLLLPTNVNL